MLTTLWGSTFVVLKWSLDPFSPFVLIALRFTLAAALFALLQPRQSREGLGLLRAALPLSLSMFAGFSLQTLGLRDTTPARSAFLTSLAVVLVPFVQFLLTRRWPQPRLLAAVALASFGVLALFHPVGLEWRRGDTLTVLGSVGFSFYIVELGAVSRRHGASALVMAQFVTMAALAWLAAVTIETPRLALSVPSLAAFVYLSLVCTVLTFWLMTWAQARVQPIEAGIVYALEPVFATAFSIALGQEDLTAKVATGGVLIVAGMLVADTGTAPADIQPVGGNG